jgi:hypothetical protein
MHLAPADLREIVHSKSCKQVLVGDGAKVAQYLKSQFG